MGRPAAIGSHGRRLPNAFSVAGLSPAARELDSGSVLVVLANSDRASETHDRRAGRHRVIAERNHDDSAGSCSAPAFRNRALISGCSWPDAKNGGEKRVEAIELDETGAPIGPVTTVIDYADGARHVRRWSRLRFRGNLADDRRPASADVRIQESRASRSGGRLDDCQYSSGRADCLERHWLSVSLERHGWNARGALALGRGRCGRQTNRSHFRRRWRRRPQVARQQWARLPRVAGFVEPADRAAARSRRNDHRRHGHRRDRFPTPGARAAVATSNGYVIVWTRNDMRDALGSADFNGVADRCAPSLLPCPRCPDGPVVLGFTGPGLGRVVVLLSRRIRAGHLLCPDRGVHDPDALRHASDE